MKVKVKETVTLTVLPGSVVEISPVQAELLGDKVEVEAVKETKAKAPKSKKGE